MKKMYLLIACCGLLGAFAACNTGKKDPEEDQMKTVAARVCGCITPLTGALSSDSRRVLERSLKSDSVERTAEEEVAKLDSAEQVKVNAELEVLENAMESEDSQLSKCLKNATAGLNQQDKKDAQANLNRFIEAMEKQKNCDLGALIFKSYLNQGPGGNQKD